VQRCQVHKARNVRDHLPEERRAYVRRQMRDAYKSKSAKMAKMMLGRLISWLEAPRGGTHEADDFGSSPSPSAAD
jgi:transposase-like protein